MNLETQPYENGLKNYVLRETTRRDIEIERVRQKGEKMRARDVERKSETDRGEKER